MCGIAGYITKKKYLNFSFKTTTNKLKNLMERRGPDQQGSFEHNFNDKSVNLFSSRLSIIDLDKRSNQPFKTNNTIIIFNGEIYNFLEIKNFLKSKKLKFFTNSDTEVLIKSYEYWGEECVNQFDGMWSFCIYDYKKRKIFISRDNFGEKPLFYFFDGNNLIFGSEIKYIFSILNGNFKKCINNEKVYDYIFKGYKSLNKNKDTFFKNIFQLEAGSNIILNLDKFKFIKKKYFNRKSLLNLKVPNNINQNSVDVKNLLIESMKLRLRSDVPISFCLSGGVDSASIVSLAYKHFNLKPKCYSIIDQDPRYNEKNEIDLLKKKLNCDIEFIKLKKEKKSDFFSNLTKLVNYHDSPISTISYYIHSKISQKSSSAGNKVIFSGTGADELFTGYYDHFLLFLSEIKKTKSYQLEKSLWKKFVKPNVRNYYLQNENLFVMKPKFREHIYYDRKFIENYMLKKNKISFYEENYSSNKLKNRMCNELFHESVPVILKEDDCNSMYNSIENRSPFLSKKLANYCLSMKKNNFIQNAYSKYVLRDSMKGILNDKIRLNRKKVGFNSNIKSILNLNNKFLYDFLNENKQIKSLINLEAIKKINLNKTISNSESKFLFSLINLKLFFDKHS
tara:strand:- start:668 stop:2527 length:1860 start_codon:yes stop_codon:yes gene_type:complete